MWSDRETEGQGDRTKLLAALRSFANLPTEANFVLGAAGLGNTFADCGHDRNVNGDINLLSLNVWKAFYLGLLTDGLIFNCL